MRLGKVKYDPFGRRIKRVNNQTPTIFVYDGANILEETDEAGAVAVRYTQGPEADQHLAQLRAGVTSYYEADGLGSITSLSDAAGAVVRTYVYNVFGWWASGSG
ncbi:MAG: hypothetical protein ACRD35_04270, partial [Candidatus Acidiferrales bacterium]